MDANSQNADVIDVVTKIKEHVDQSLKNKVGGSYSYIIGNNGLGKSRILRELADSYENNFESPVTTILCVTNTLYDRFDIGRNKQKIKYLGARNADLAPV